MKRMYFEVILKTGKTMLIRGYSLSDALYYAEINSSDVASWKVVDKVSYWKEMYNQ